MIPQERKILTVADKIREKIKRKATETPEKNTKEIKKRGGVRVWHLFNGGNKRWRIILVGSADARIPRNHHQRYKKHSFWRHRWSEIQIAFQFSPSSSASVDSTNGGSHLGLLIPIPIYIIFL